MGRSSDMVSRMLGSEKGNNSERFEDMDLDNHYTWFETLKSTEGNETSKRGLPKSTDTSNETSRINHHGRSNSHNRGTEKTTLRRCPQAKL